MQQEGILAPEKRSVCLYTEPPGRQVKTPTHNMADDFRKIRNITIFGTGLIGGSLGLALKAKGFRGTITGLGRRMSTLEVALQHNAIDHATIDISAAIRECDFVIIGTPVDRVSDTVRRISECAKRVRTDAATLYITDVAGVKGQIVKEVNSFLQVEKPNCVRFVGSHPMAGSEKTGVAAARADLFNGAKCIVTPTGNTDSQALARVVELWKFVGANVHLLDPNLHDHLIAGASHLPHLIASILTKTVAQIEGDSVSASDYAASGFRDTTRIASGSPEIWRGIFMQNAPALQPMIDAVIENLAQFKSLLENGDAGEIESILNASKSIRDAWEVRQSNT